MPGFGPRSDRAPSWSPTDWEDAVRKAISLGGDSDTIACITGGIAAAFYGGVPRTFAPKLRTDCRQQMRGNPRRVPVELPLRRVK